MNCVRRYSADSALLVLVMKEDILGVADSDRVASRIPPKMAEPMFPDKMNMVSIYVWSFR